MKSANILITQRGLLKIADFGLARSFSSNHKNENRFTNRVITLWYRPADVLLGERNYGPDVDLWGAGCIMAELWTRTPIMQGSTEFHQLTLISQLCGSITPETLPGVEHLKLFKDIKPPQNLKRKVRDRLKAYIKNRDALDLLDKLLTIDPKTRIDSDAALDHPFFYNDPMPEDFSPMLASHRRSMFEYVSSRRKSQAAQPGVPRGQPTTNDGQYHDHVF